LLDKGRRIMSWLTIPAVGTDNKLPIALNGTIELIKLIGGLKDTLNDLSTRNAIELLDELAANPVDPADPVVIAVTAITNRSVDDVVKDWKQFRDKYNGVHGVKQTAVAHSMRIPS
jgi:hypothetical protein